jgi:AraC family transcriptional regulator
MSFTQFSHLNSESVPEKLVYHNNTLVFSELKQFYKPIQSEGISIKYVSAGVENYVLNNKKITLKANECFISNQPLDGSVGIESNFNVNGTCLNISYHLIGKIEASLKDCRYFEGEESGGVAILSEEIFEVFTLGNSHLSQKLFSLKQKHQGNKPFGDENNENLFFEFGEAFVLDQKPQLIYLSKLNNAKKETKKDIVKRLLWAKEYLEANYNTDLKVNELAKVATMSDFHFSRMFKQVFGYAPYQYQVKLRMEKARQLLNKRAGLVQDIGLAVGYSDIYTFSKAFKRYFGLYPSYLFS